MNIKLSIVLLLSVVILNQPNKAKLVHLDEFKERLEIQNDTLYVYNFWATWCIPCVKELPYFTKLSKEWKEEKVKFVFISLDDEEKIEKKLNPFLKKKKIIDECLVMGDGKMNDWINAIDSSFTGAIPATLLIRNSDKSRAFFQRDFENINELKEVISPYLFNH